MSSSPKSPTSPSMSGFISRRPIDARLLDDLDYDNTPKSNNTCKTATSAPCIDKEQSTIQEVGLETVYLSKFTLGREEESYHSDISSELVSKKNYNKNKDRLLALENSINSLLEENSNNSMNSLLDDTVNSDDNDSINNNQLEQYEEEKEFDSMSESSLLSVGSPRIGSISSPALSYGISSTVPCSLSQHLSIELASKLPAKNYNEAASQLSAPSKTTPRSHNLIRFLGPTADALPDDYIKDVLQNTDLATKEIDEVLSYDADSVTSAMNVLLRSTLDDGIDDEPIDTEAEKELEEYWRKKYEEREDRDAYHKWYQETFVKYRKDGEYDPRVHRKHLRDEDLTIFSSKPKMSEPQRRRLQYKVYRDEVENCTFMPKIRAKRTGPDDSMMMRAASLQFTPSKKKMAALQDMMEKKTEELAECTFEPLINDDELYVLCLEEGNSLRHDGEDRFVELYERARQIRQYKIDRIPWVLGREGVSPYVSGAEKEWMRLEMDQQKTLQGLQGQIEKKENDLKDTLNGMFGKTISVANREPRRTVKGAANEPGQGGNFGGGFFSAFASLKKNFPKKSAPNPKTEGKEKNKGKGKGKPKAKPKAKPLEQNILTTGLVRGKGKGKFKRNLEKEAIEKDERFIHPGIASIKPKLPVTMMESNHGYRTASPRARTIATGGKGTFKATGKGDLGRGLLGPVPTNMSKGNKGDTASIGKGPRRQSISSAIPKAQSMLEGGTLVSEAPMGPLTAPSTEHVTSNTFFADRVRLKPAPLAKVPFKPPQRIRQKFVFV